MTPPRFGVSAAVAPIAAAAAPPPALVATHVPVALSAAPGAAAGSHRSRHAALGRRGLRIVVDLAAVVVLAQRAQAQPRGRRRRRRRRVLSTATPSLRESTESEAAAELCFPRERARAPASRTVVMGGGGGGDERENTGGASASRACAREEHRRGQRHRDEEAQSFTAEAALRVRLQRHTPGYDPQSAGKRRRLHPAPIRCPCRSHHSGPVLHAANRHSCGCFRVQVQPVQGRLVFRKAE